MRSCRISVCQTQSSCPTSHNFSSSDFEASGLKPFHAPSPLKRTTNNSPPSSICFPRSSRICFCGPVCFDYPRRIKIVPIVWILLNLGDQFRVVVSASWSIQVISYQVRIHALLPSFVDPRCQGSATSFVFMKNHAVAKHENKHM